MTSPKVYTGRRKEMMVMHMGKTWIILSQLIGNFDDRVFL